MLYFAQGDAILTEDELLEKSTHTQVKNFFNDLTAGKSPSEVKFSTGKLTSKNVIKAFKEAPKADPVDFQPIGLGKPLMIMIREVYTGQYPTKGLFGGKKDLLVTSAIKSITTYDAKPRAMNFLMGAVPAKSKLKRPAAASDGTPLVFYSPALIEKSLTLDLTLIFDQFPQEVFNTVSNTFQSAAGIPIFLAHSAYLLAAGAVAKIVGNVGESLFDGKPVFTVSEPLNIYLPGEPPLQAGFLLVTDGNVDNIESDFRSKYKVAESGQVVDDAGKAYSGDIPYIVLTIDGTPDPALASFTPTAASAAVLSRFFGMKDGQPQLLGSLTDAVKLYNDFTFRQEVDRLDKQIDGMPDGTEKDSMMTKRNALAKNILTDILKKG
jgi:hypothetical protein